MIDIGFRISNPHPSMELPSCFRSEDCISLWHETEELLDGEGWGAAHSDASEGNGESWETERSGAFCKIDGRYWRSGMQGEAPYYNRSFMIYFGTDTN